MVEATNVPDVQEDTGLKEEARNLVNVLLSYAMTPQAIADALDGRVSRRTVYRWSKGESGPQQKSDVEALRALVATRTPVDAA